MAPTLQPPSRSLDEVSDAIRCVGNAPRLRSPQGWRLDLSPDCWRIVVNGTGDAQTGERLVLLGAGIAAEHLVIALEARHLRVEVRELPRTDLTAAVTVRVLGHLHPTALMTQLRDLAQVPGARLGSRTVITPSDRRVLSLTAAARAAALQWPAGFSDGQAATLTTPGDTPTDWVRAGRALGRLLLRAASLGVDATTSPVDPSWPPDRTRGVTPQLQLTLTGRP